MLTFLKDEFTFTLMSHKLTDSLGFERAHRGDFSIPLAVISSKTFTVFFWDDNSFVLTEEFHQTTFSIVVCVDITDRQGNAERKKKWWKSKANQTNRVADVFLSWADVL